MFYDKGMIFVHTTTEANCIFVYKCEKHGEILPETHLIHSSPFDDS